MESSMNDRPGAVELVCEVDTRPHVFLDCTRDVWREFGDVYCRQCVEADRNAIRLAHTADCSCPCRCPRVHVVGPGIGVEIEEIELVVDRPLNGVFQTGLSGVNANSIFQCHSMVPWSGCGSGSSSSNRKTNSSSRRGGCFLN
jgi:hypothetical protein